MPVRPGDTLRAVVEVIAARTSGSKPDRGLVSLRYTTVNQRRDTVMTMIGQHLLRRRP